MKVIKNNHKIEDFSLSKLIDSLIDTFNITKVPDGLKEDFIKKTLAEFHSWQQAKSEVTSGDIRLKIGEILENLHPESAYIYKNFKKIL